MLIKSMVGLRARLVPVCLFGCGFSVALGMNPTPNVVDQPVAASQVRSEVVNHDKPPVAKQAEVAKSSATLLAELVACDCYDENRCVNIIRLVEAINEDKPRDMLSFLVQADNQRVAIIRASNIDKEGGVAKIKEAVDKDRVLKYIRDKIKRLDGAGGNSNWKKNFGQAISNRAYNAVGDSIEGVIRRADGKLVVPATDSILDGLVRFWHKMTSVLFHNSKEPFTKVGLERWAVIIKTDLDGFYALIKGRDLTESRSNRSEARIFDPEDQTIVNQDQLLNELIIKRYAEQFEMYASEIERRKAYYKNDREVVFIADQIVGWLLEFRQIILSIKSLKDAAAKFGQNPVVITGMQKNIDRLFTELVHAAIPSSYTDGRKTTSSTERQPRSNYPMSYGTEFDSEGF